MNVAFKKPARPASSLDSIAEALLLPTGIDGVYARTEHLRKGRRRAGRLHLVATATPDTEVLRFPPVMSRRQIEKSGYLKSFPHLLGCVSCLRGTSARSRPRSSATSRRATGPARSPPADLVLSPAACYPVYPLAASRGHVPARRPDIRRRLRLLPPRAVKGYRPAAVVPHARICLHRHAGADPASARAGSSGPGHRRRNWASTTASSTPAIRSLAAAAS